MDASTRWRQVVGRIQANGTLAACLFVLAGFAISFVLLGPLLNAKIGLTDENDVPYYMGTSGKVAWADIPRTLVEKTEIGAFAGSSRMRPVYYFARVTETALWGFEGRYWFAWRIVMFAFVIAVMAWLYVRFTGLLLGGALTIFTLSFAMWADIWARSTGTSEQLTSFGLVIFAIGAVIFVERWRREESLRSGALLAALGALIAMGAKENMLVLEIPLMVALAFGLWRRRLDAVSVVVILLAMAMGAWVASSVGIYLLRTRVEDLYGNKIGSNLLAGRLMVMIAVGTIISAVVIWVTDRLIARYRGAAARLAYRETAKRFTLIGTAIIAVVLTQHVFYTGQLPSRSRYDFPALFAVPTLVILVTWALGRTAELLAPGRPVQGALRGCAALGLLIYAALVAWRLPPAVAAHVRWTTTFDDAIVATRAEARQHPTWPIVVRSSDPWDFEPIQALGLIFIARGINNPRFLVHTVPPERRMTAFEKDSLSNVLAKQSREGFGARGYLPLDNFAYPASSECFVVVLSPPALFDAERKAAKAPVAGLNCQPLPLSLYWEQGRLVFAIWPSELAASR